MEIVKNDLFFSVVMPNYNKNKYLAESIQSVLNQKYKNYELIIVDDGSTDDSVNTIRKFDNNKIRLICQKNSGASVARNVGIQKASYEYIAFIDSDDLWLEDFLLEMKEMIIKYPACSAYGCSFLRNDVYRSANNIERKDYIITNYFDWIMNGNQGLTASTSVVKKEIFDEIEMFPPNVNNWEDLDLWARIGLYYDIAFTDNVYAIYNDIPNSTSKKSGKLSAPFVDNYKDYLNDSRIKSSRKNSFEEYIYMLKLESAWQQYLLDRNKQNAIKKALTCYKTKRYRRRLLSGIAQYLLTPSLYNIIRGYNKR